MSLCLSPVWIFIHILIWHIWMRHTTLMTCVCDMCVWHVCVTWVMCVLDHIVCRARERESYTMTHLSYAFSCVTWLFFDMADLFFWFSSARESARASAILYDSACDCECVWASKRARSREYERAREWEGLCGREEMCVCSVWVTCAVAEWQESGIEGYSVSTRALSPKYEDPYTKEP